MPNNMLDLLKAAIAHRPGRQSAAPGNPRAANDALPRSAAASAPDAAGAGGLLKIIVNRRLRSSWRVHANSKTGERVLSIPKVLADAPQEIHECLTNWAMLPMARRARRTTARVKREMEETIRAYMESCGVAGGGAYHTADPAAYKHQTKGNAYDLQELFDDVNRTFFNGEIKSYIRWGRSASKTSYHAVKIDKEGKPFNLITISGLYDSIDVPRFAIRGLLYHEMLHIAIPPRTVNGRRVIHGKDFKAAERRYPLYKQWIKWEEENMGRLLAKARRKARR